MDSNHLQPDAPQQEELDVLALLMHYLSYWKWFVLSLLVCFAVAFGYLRYATPVYQISSRLLLSDEKKGGMTAEMAAFEQMGLGVNSANVDNEVEVFRSIDLMHEVVRNLDIYITYFAQGRISESELYGAESPLYLRMEQSMADSLSRPAEYYVALEPGQPGARFWSEDENFELRVDTLPGFVDLPVGRVFVGLYPTPVTQPLTLRMHIRPPLQVARGLVAALTVNPVSKTAAVVTMELKMPNVSKGRAILNSLLDNYNDITAGDKNRTAQNTALFIDDRLQKLGVELSAEEEKVQSFLQSNRLTDVGSEAQLYLQQTGVYEQRRLELETQLNLVNFVAEYLQKPENRYALVPTNLGINDAALVATINEYNQVLLERERLQSTARPNNPAFVRVDEQAAIWRDNILEGIRNVQRSWEIARADMQRQGSLNEARLKEVPLQSRKFVELSRQQQIKEALYVFLLQKREETNLTMAAIAPSAKFIEQPLASSAPVAPKRMVIYMVSLLLGLALPAGVIHVLGLLKTTFDTKEELQKLTRVPLLGEIPLKKSPAHLVVTEAGLDGINEMFRLLRTNVQFVMSEPGCKVLTVTSGLGAEGKSFISLNLSMSFAMTDKKVCLVGLDIRKPKLAQYLNLEAQRGITHYLAGQEVPLEELCLPSGVHPNLYVLPSGPVPPNPNELLTRDRLDQLMAQLRERFDLIVVDTAPVGAVSDTLLLNRLTDINLFVCRASQTPNKIIELVNGLHANQQLKKLYLVLNATDIYKKRYGYGYGYGKKYGYGYGYGYHQKA